MTIKIKAFEFDSIAEALAWLDADGRGNVITIGGKVLVVSDDEANRLAASGAYFAYLFDHEMPDGTLRTMSVPVNDR